MFVKCMELTQNTKLKINKMYLMHCSPPDKAAISSIPFIIPIYSDRSLLLDILDVRNSLRSLCALVLLVCVLLPLPWRAVSVYNWKLPPPVWEIEELPCLSVCLSFSFFLCFSLAAHFMLACFGDVLLKFGPGEPYFVNLPFKISD